MILNLSILRSNSFRLQGKSPLKNLLSYIQKPPDDAGKGLSYIQKPPDDAGKGLSYIQKLPDDAGKGLSYIQKPPDDTGKLLYIRQGIFSIAETIHALIRRAE